MEIGNRIAFLRTAKQYSVNKLANKAGISQSYLRDIELDKKKPTIDTLYYICEGLGISLYDFFDDNFQNSLSNDPVLGKIYQLTPEQRTLLLKFLNSIIE